MNCVPWGDDGPVHCCTTFSVFSPADLCCKKASSWHNMSVRLCDGIQRHSLVSWFSSFVLGCNYDGLAVMWSCVLDDVLDAGAFCFSRKMKSCHRYPASHHQMLPTKMTRASTWKRWLPVWCGVLLLSGLSAVLCTALFRPSSWFCVHCCSLSGLSDVLCAPLFGPFSWFCVHYCSLSSLSDVLRTLRLDHLHGFVFTVVRCLACQMFCVLLCLDHLHGFVFTVAHCVACIQMFCVLLCLDCLHGFVFTVVHCLACSHGKLSRGACIQMKGEKNRGEKGRCDHALWQRGKDALMASCSAKCLPEGVWPYPVMKKDVLMAGCSAKKGRCDHILWQKEKRCISGRLLSQILARKDGACQGLTAFMCVCSRNWSC